MSEPSKPSDSTDPRVELALREYFERVDRGEVVNRDEFLLRHIEIAAALRSFFAVEEPLRKMAVSTGTDESSSISTQSVAARGQETVLPRLPPGGAPGTAGSGLAGQFGRYQIVRALGQGAMGAVYLALDTQLKRNVAIKTPHFDDDPTGELLKRFYREAEAAATLMNANICPVYDVGQIDGKHFISMAYIEGKPLSDLIYGRKPQNELQIVFAVHKLARALQQAHDHGIVHRDLKPANIMVNKQGEPIIMDFGLARKRRVEGEASLTQSGMIMGSPAYMSPEQVERDPDSVGPASDQYSLGVVLYEMLTGQLPFRGSVVNVLAQIITKSPTPPGELRPGLDPRIEAVCLRMMAKKSADRFASMKAVADELATIVKHPAGQSMADEKAPTASRAPTGPLPPSADARASRAGKSLNQRAINANDLNSIEELVRKCLDRCEYDQMIQIIERIPQDRRNAALETLQEQAREKIDQIAFLICEIDEADRRGDRQTALKQAAALLNLKPGHERANAIREKYSGDGRAAAARNWIKSQFTKPWSEGGWIPWSVLAFGLAACAVLTGVIVITLGTTAIVIDIKDPDVTVSLQGKQITISGPKAEKVSVEPGEQQLKITYGGLETLTKSFEVKRGQKKTVTVSVIDKKIAADLDRVPMGLIQPTEKNGQTQETSPIASGQRSPQPVQASVSAAPNAPELLVAPFDEAVAKNGQQNWARSLQREVELTNRIGMKMVLIPPGRFEMGSRETRDQLLNEFPIEAASKQDWLQPNGEWPVHVVTITRPFFLGKYEVTKREFQQFVEEDGYRTDAEKDGKGGMGLRPEGDKFLGQSGPQYSWRDWGVDQADDAPVVNVTYHDATEFCAWLSRKEGKVYRLPSEAEWEYACRAGTTGRSYNGDDPEELTKIGNIRDATWEIKGSENPPRQTTARSSDGYGLLAPVGKFQPNHFGLYDMLGNVWEFCADFFDEDYFRHSPERDPAGPPTGRMQVTRGGAWTTGGLQARAARRNAMTPDGRAFGTGFRVALSVENTVAGRLPEPSAAPVAEKPEPTPPAGTPASSKRFSARRGSKGKWMIVDGHLEQTSFDPNACLYFGDPAWTDYDFSVDVMQGNGNDQVCQLFRVKRDEGSCFFGLATFRNSNFTVEYQPHRHARKGAHARLVKKQGRLYQGQWYTMLVRVRGTHAECFLNDARLFNFKCDELTSGSVGLRTWGTVYRFRNIKVTAPDGTVLLEGLPDLN